MPQVSVIVPVYKTEQYLKRCVDSILNQTLRDLELILVDDGSPDLCPAICDDFANKDNRVRVIHQKNAGAAAARNAGLSIAGGEYIAFADSDDYLELNMYDSMMKIARSYDCDLVMCDCVKEFGDHAELYTHNIRPGYYDREQLIGEYFPHLLIMPNVEYPPTISNCLCLFRHRHSQNEDVSLRYEEGIRYSEDLLFGALMVYQSQSFYYMKEDAFYHYNCANQQSVTHTFIPDKWTDYRKLYHCIEESFGQCKEFDFREQMDKVLLFFVYNAVGEVMRCNDLDGNQMKDKTLEILSDNNVTEMFRRLRIHRLPISRKQKILTWCYKKRKGIGLMVSYYGKDR